MFVPDREFRRLVRLARKARRRGDAAAAEHWLRVADRQLRVVARMNAFTDEAFLRDLAWHNTDAVEGLLNRTQLPKVRNPG